MRLTQGIAYEPLVKGYLERYRTIRVLRFGMQRNHVTTRFGFATYLFQL
jgi:hypothetical protein